MTWKKSPEKEDTKMKFQQNVVLLSMSSESYLSFSENRALK